MKHLFSILIICLAALFANAQTIEKAAIYKGAVGEFPVTLFMIPIENDCGIPHHYAAMYQYNDKSLWLQLSVSYNKHKDFLLVEQSGSGDFTGMLLLKKKDSSFSGSWISPDGKRKLNVQLKPVKASAQELEKYRDKWERINYENYDC